MKLRLISEGEHKDAFGTHKWKTYAQIPTNADRIRAMTDEELAYELAVSGCPKIYFSKDKGRVDCRAESELTEGDCVKCWLGWLKQEAK